MSLQGKSFVTESLVETFLNDKNPELDDQNRDIPTNESSCFTKVSQESLETNKQQQTPTKSAVDRVVNQEQNSDVSVQIPRSSTQETVKISTPTISHDTSINESVKRPGTPIAPTVSTSSTVHLAASATTAATTTTISSNPVSSLSLQLSRQTVQPSESCEATSLRLDNFKNQLFRQPTAFLQKEDPTSLVLSNVIPRIDNQKKFAQKSPKDSDYVVYEDYDPTTNQCGKGILSFSNNILFYCLLYRFYCCFNNKQKINFRIYFFNLFLTLNETFKLLS